VKEAAVKEKMAAQTAKLTHSVYCARKQVSFLFFPFSFPVSFFNYQS
jgi:hypothetical protein